MTRAIRWIRLSHFRSHKAFQLSLDARPVALHGPNGAGKTNVLEAVSLLSPGRGLRRAGMEELIRRPESLGWKIAAAVEAQGPTVEVETFVSHPGARREVRVDGKTASQTALGAVAPMIWLTPEMDRLWTEGAAGRRRFLDRMTLIFEPAHGERSLAYEKAMRERNRLLKDGPADPSWLSALEAQMAATGAAIARARAETAATLNKAQPLDDKPGGFPRADLTALGSAEARFTALLTAGADAKAAEPEAREGLAETFARGRAADGAAGRTLSGPHRSDLGARYAARDMDAALCSTGEQKALLISLVLAAARALSEAAGAPPILLLDEVAAHLDPDRRAALFDEIVGLRAQAWMTGAEAGLFEALGERGFQVALPAP